jgi:hypothetical protein
MAEEQPIDTFRRRLARACHIMHRAPDAQAVAGESPHPPGGKRLLAELDAERAARECDIDPIPDHETERRMRSAKLGDVLDERPRRERRLAEVESPGAAARRCGGEDGDAIPIAAPVAHHEQRRSFEPEAEARTMRGVRG